MREKINIFFETLDSSYSIPYICVNFYSAFLRYTLTLYRDSHVIPCFDTTTPRGLFTVVGRKKNSLHVINHVGHVRRKRPVYTCFKRSNRGDENQGNEIIKSEYGGKKNETKPRNDRHNGLLACFIARTP